MIKIIRKDCDISLNILYIICMSNVYAVLFALNVRRTIVEYYSFIYFAPHLYRQRSVTIYEKKMGNEKNKKKNRITSTNQLFRVTDDVIKLIRIICNQELIIIYNICTDIRIKYR